MNYRPHPDATPERERSALAAAFRILLLGAEEVKAAGEDGGENDAKEDADVRARESIP
jgi:hypothetical protein